MPGIAELFAAWLALLASSPSASGELNPPAAADTIAEAEREMGHALTDELRTLYALGNGQPSAGGYDPERLEGDAYLFVGRWFRSIDEALEERRRRLEDDDGAFEPDWFPFATDDEGNGLAVDLESDDRHDRGELILFKDGEAGSARKASIAELLRGFLNSADPLALHQRSADPHLALLGRWFRGHGGASEYEVHQQFTDALFPPIAAERTYYGAEFSGFYDQVLAVQIDRMRQCNPTKLDAALRATRLAVDWLLHSAQIDEARHEHLRAVISNEDGLGDRMLARAGAEAEPDGAGGCRRYSWLFDRGP